MLFRQLAVLTTSASKACCSDNCDNFVVFCTCRILPLGLRFVVNFPLRIGSSYIESHHDSIYMTLKSSCADIHLYDNSFVWHIHTIPTHRQKKASFIALLYIEECRLVLSQQLLDLSCTDPLYFPLICRLWVKDETLFVCFGLEVPDHVPFFVARRATKLTLSAQLNHLSVS